MLGTAYLVKSVASVRSITPSYLNRVGCKEKRYYLFTKSIPIFAVLRQKQTFCPNKTKAESLLTQWPNTLTYLDIFFSRKVAEYTQGGRTCKLFFLEF